MENFLRLFFGIFFTFAHLQAHPLHLSDSKISYMRKYVTCPSDARFSTPRNVMTPCISTALNCCLSELDNKVKEKCSDRYEYVDDAVEFLNGTIEEWQKNHPVTNSSQCACDKWPETHLSEFLSSMESLLQLVNSVTES